VEAHDSKSININWTVVYGDLSAGCKNRRIAGISLAAAGASAAYQLSPGRDSGAEENKRPWQCRVLYCFMVYSSKDLELSSQRVAKDRRRIASQEADIRGIILREESSGLAEERLIALNSALRWHIFERDLIAAEIKLDRQ
jgi:hypothetical protein